MKKKKLLIGISTLLIIATITTGCGKEIEVKNGSKVAISIDKNKFTATEYYDKIKEDNISTLVDMIDHSLLDKKYKTTKEETEEIDKQIEQIKSYYGQDEKTYNSVIKQYFGVENEKELREKLSLEYKRKEAVEDYVEKNIKEDEIKKYYEEKTTGKMSAKHILIAIETDEKASDEDKKKAEEKAEKQAKKIIKELDEGKKFDSLAKKYSKDTATATNGGDLGYFDLSDMVEEFSNAVKELKINEYTKDPVKTEYGYHIILKTGEKKKPKLSKVKKEIKEKIREEKLNEDNTLFYKSLKDYREENKIKWNDDTLEKAYNKYIDDLIENSTQKNS